jgi:hypothetical protein
MTDREPLGQAINGIIGQLSGIGRLLSDPATYDEVAAEEADLWTIKLNIDLICTYIKERQKAQRIRIVK